jgi:hypothetical protein
VPTASAAAADDDDGEDSKSAPAEEGSDDEAGSSSDSSASESGADSDAVASSAPSQEKQTSPAGKSSTAVRCPEDIATALAALMAGPVASPGAEDAPLPVGVGSLRDALGSALHQWVLHEGSTFVGRSPSDPVVLDRVQKTLSRCLLRE